MIKSMGTSLAVMALIGQVSSVDLKRKHHHSKAAKQQSRRHTKEFSHLDEAENNDTDLIQFKTAKMDDFDYTLVIEYNRLSIRELDETLKILYTAGSFECLAEIEYLADEIIHRQNEYQYAIRNVENKPFQHLIYSVFETLKKHVIRGFT